MVELKSRDYYKIVDLLRGGIRFPEIVSIIEENNPGRIFVDEIAEPKTSLIWNQGMRGFYLIGDSNNAFFLSSLNDFIDKNLKRFLKSRRINYIEVSGNTQEWNIIIQEVFKNRDIKGWNQLIYNFKSDSVLNEIDNNFIYDIYSINDSGNDYRKYTNWEYYKGVLTEFWDDINTLKRIGNCYYAVDKNRIIGICYSGFATNDTKTIGIEVDDGYRKQNVGYNIATYCVNEVLNENRLAWWDCTNTNYGSRALAEKLGFTLIEDYICYSFDM